jgi:hypothetical protein
MRLLTPVIRSTMAQIGTALRTLMNNNGFSGVLLIGYDHNWDDAGTYPVQLVRLRFLSCRAYPLRFHQMQQAGSAFDGAAFHCYGVYARLFFFLLKMTAG